MKNLYLDDDSSKWDNEENNAKDDFLRDLQVALGEGSASYGDASYPAVSRFIQEEFSRNH